MEAGDIKRVLQDLDSGKIITIVAAVKRYNQSKGNIPDSIFQSAFDLQRVLKFQCCVEKAQTLDNLNKLCIAISQLK